MFWLYFKYFYAIGENEAKGHLETLFKKMFNEF